MVIQDPNAKGNATWKAAFWSAAWRGLCLVAAGSVAGLVSNAVRRDGVSLAGYVAPLACSGGAVDHEPSLLRAAGVADLCGRTGTLVADVRSAEAYADGHIAGAIHLPCTTSGQHAEHLAHLLQGKSTLVVYGETAGDALHVVRQLSPHLALPVSNIVVLDEGWQAWKAADLACASGPCDKCEGMTTHESSH